MASQVILDGDTASIKAPLNIMAPAPTINLRGFNWGTVDSKFEETPISISSAHHDENGVGVGQRVMVDGTIPVQVAELSAKPTPAPPPFPLTKFQGAYAGNGYNTIWRPRPTGDKTFKTVDLGGKPDDNILELNLTTEQLTFGETIGAIPNRGLFQQPDVTLQGFMYLQTVQDVTNIETGKGDNPQITDIHFEPGMWLTVPASVANPKDGPTLARMASIPHGTTVNAQCLAPAQATAGGPTFETIDISPFPIGDPSNKIFPPFPAMKSLNNKAPRLPQDLSKFNQAETINDAIIKNPNQVLANAIKGQTIKNNIAFEVSTGQPKAGCGGGGTANISFLVGTEDLTQSNPVVNPNANAALMSSKFWIETVEYSVDVPKFTTSNLALLRPKMDNPNAPIPTFLVQPPPTLPSPAKTIKILGTQIQYSQTVNLNFAGLTWPHVSVATLVPQSPQFFRMT